MQLKDIPDYLILQKVEDRWEIRNQDPDFLVDVPSPFLQGIIPEKLIFKKLQQLVKKGYLDYGVSIRTAWLTQAGKEYLKAARMDAKLVD